MAAGLTQVTVKDGGATPTARSVNNYSSDGSPAGNLSPCFHIIDGENETQGAKADAPYAGGGGAATLVALLKGIWNLLAAAIPAGTNIIGSILGRTSKVLVSPVVTASSVYTAGNLVGGKMTFSNVFDSANSGVLQSVRVRCKSVQSMNLKLYLFTSDPSGSTWTDKAAPAIVAADIPKVVGPFLLTSADNGLGTETTWELDGIGAAIVSGSADLYGVIVTTGTPTFASTSDMSVELTTIKD